MLDRIAREADMWIIEVNILGRRYTLHVNHRPEATRLAAGIAPWRQWKQRIPRAAA
jgi:hypothetical protein